MAPDVTVSNYMIKTTPPHLFVAWTTARMGAEPILKNHEDSINDDDGEVHSSVFLRKPLWRWSAYSLIRSTKHIRISATAGCCEAQSLRSKAFLHLKWQFSARAFSRNQGRLWGKRVGTDWNKCYVERESYVIRKLRVSPVQSVDIPASYNHLR